MNDESAPGRNIALLISVGSVIAMGVTWGLTTFLGGTASSILFLLCQVFVISIVIWQACDPFAEAAQWIGHRYHLPGSVRGATLDAISSSLPELFSGIFFVVLAVTYTSGETTNTGSEGYGATVATCAGSAVYNMILIPAICAITISYSRKSRPTIDVSPIVILRDGLWFLGCEFVLIICLFQESIHWWMGVLLIGLYIVYVVMLYQGARKFQNALRAVHSELGVGTRDVTSEKITEVLLAKDIYANRSLVTEIRNRLFAEATGEASADDEDNDEDIPEAASFFFGLGEIRLSSVSVWGVIIVSTLIAAISCYWLVEVTRSTSTLLNIPIFFVAIILAAAASSVPDTFLSLGASLRGDDDGAVSNAFGSNIFDICICLSVPLIIASYLNGWQPIELTTDGKPMPGLVGIRILLCLLTLTTLLIMWHNQQLTRRKAYILIVLYLVFVLYAVAGSLGFTFDVLYRSFVSG